MLKTAMFGVWIKAEAVIVKMQTLLCIEEHGRRGSHRSCTDSKSIIAASLLIVCLLAVQVYANSYQIPIRGSGYPTLTVSVEIPRGWASDSVRQAMQIWNQAQIWFAKTYFSNGKVYTFTESGAQYVHVIWAPYNPAYGGRAQSNCMANDAEGAIRGMNCSVSIVLTYSNGTNLTPATILHGALHEFGHVLGLRHPDPNILPEDLMNPEWPDIPALAPSTLDLYAVHLLANAIGTTSSLVGGVVTLPANIPYKIYASNLTTTYTSITSTSQTYQTLTSTTISNTLQTSTNLSHAAALAGPTIYGYISILAIIGVTTITGLYMRGRHNFATIASPSH